MRKTFEKTKEKEKKKKGFDSSDLDCLHVCFFVVHCLRTEYRYGHCQAYVVHGYAVWRVDVEQHRFT
jgi:hypothetical protein